MKTEQGIRMNSSIKIWLTCTAVALLLGWNLPGIQGDEWFNVPNPLIENDHIRNQSLENCAEKRFFTWFNCSRTVDEDFGTITVKMSWVPIEDILFLECYASYLLNGIQIGTSGSSGTNMCHKHFECPSLKGKVYQIPPATYPIPLVIKKGHYQLKVSCKNQDGAIIFCAKWTFTWV